ncbi:MAG: diaminobutyrate acetyltransferase [Sinobacteraceae bacterium]|nr:diaminobutyrate acetyltransferase [Nevskiaceae bacterium]
MNTEHSIHFRSPNVSDGRTVWELVRDGGTLEANTPYCYLLLCSHFAEHCLVAEKDGEIVGFVMAYRPPSDPEAVFVWQVGVAPAGRGQGLASRMLDQLILQPGNCGVRFLTATVEPDNVPSNKLFSAFARKQGAALEHETGYGPELFPPGHAPEPLLRIGPLPTRKTTD